MPHTKQHLQRSVKVTVVFRRVKSVVRIPEHLQEELLDYAKRNGYLSGPIFLSRNGIPINRTYVSASIRSLCAEAQVPAEKGNPRCLKRLYQSIRGRIEDNISLLVEQAMDRLLKQEQLSIGWEEAPHT